MDIAAVVLLRIYLKVKVFPNDKVAQVLLGDGKLFFEFPIFISLYFVFILLIYIKSVH